MARKVCIRLPDPPPLDRLSVLIPGMGAEIKSIRDFKLEAYDVCADAQSFIQGLQPFFMAMGMPLCILGCVNAVISVFDPQSPIGIDIGAIPKIPEECACLASFTPFGFCGVIRAMITAIRSILTCIVGLIGDVVELQTQAANLASLPDEASQFTAKCVAANADVLLKGVQESFGAITTLLESTTFLFKFVGVPFSGIGDLSGESAAEVLETITTVILPMLTAIEEIIGNICP